MDRKVIDKPAAEASTFGDHLIAAVERKSKKGAKASPATEAPQSPGPAASAWGHKPLASTSVAVQAPAAAGAGVLPAPVASAELPSTPMTPARTPAKADVIEPATPMAWKPVSTPVSAAVPQAGQKKPYNTPSAASFATPVAVPTEKKAAVAYSAPVSAVKYAASKAVPVASPAPTDSAAALSPGSTKKDALAFLAREVAILRIRAKKEREYCSSQMLKTGMNKHMSCDGAL
jgi:hypothetical protein